MLKTIGLAVLTAGLLAAGPASACKGKTVLFSDDFRQLDDTWPGDVPGALSVEDGKVKFKATPNAAYNVLYGGSLFDDADMCVTVQIPNNLDQRDSVAAGPIFWGQDYANYYAFLITPDGRAGLVRLYRGKWVYLVNYRKAEGIKGGPGDKNVLRLTTSGNTITAYVNDVKFSTIKSQVPPGGGQVGLHAESEEAHRNTWKFIDLKVTDLPPQ
ncbi:MAG: hypothetical protein ACHQAY_09845 [Hyphomicrobiales bacterium]